LSVIGTPCGGAGALARVVEVGRDDGVEPRVMPLDPLEIMLEQFQAADFAAAQMRGEPLRRPEGDILHERIPWIG
jgi:hypothetical protein